MARNPQDIAARWAQQMGQSQDKWREGVENVTVAPGAAAARQADAWATNTVNAKAKWANNVAKVGLAEWKEAMVTKGGARIGTGAQAAQGKFADFMTQLLPRIEQVKATLPPRGNKEQNINRAVTFMRGMGEWTYKK